MLVTLRYARGWRLPGGGRKQGEAPERAILRELGEEIGLISHGPVCMAAEVAESALFVVEDVRYRPRWSLEVKAVRAFPLDQLPPETAPITRQLIDAAQVNRGG